MTTLTTTTALTDVLDDIEAATQFVKGLTENELGLAHAQMKNYIQRVNEERGHYASSINTQELASELGWDGYDIAVDILIDNDTYDTLEEMVEWNGLEEHRETISKALDQLQADIHSVKTVYKRVSD